MFSWSSGSSTTTSRPSGTNRYPGRRSGTNGVVTAHAVTGSIHPSITRAQHLESYLQDATLQRSTRRVSSDDTTYDTVFQTTSGVTLMLRVHLPSSFASKQCPEMSLAGVRARHSWCNSQSMKITGYAPIQSESAWRSSGLKLGTAVHAVVKQLQLYPPQILEVTDPALRALQKKMAPTTANENGHAAANGNGHAAARSPQRAPVNNGRNGTSQVPPPNYSSWVQTQEAPAVTTRPLSKAETKPLPPIHLPSIPSRYDEVDDMTLEELEKYMSDELEFLTIVGKLDKYKEIQTLRASVMKENFRMANASLVDEKELKELSNSCEDIKKAMQEKLAAFQELESEQTKLSAPPDTKSVLKKLSEAADESFEQSETIANDWVDDGGLNVDEFCKQFLEIRELHHKRAATAERLSHQYHNR